MINNQFIGTVRDLTFKGAGVVDHPDGRVFFVSGAWPGDEGTFEIQSYEKRYGFAKLVQLKTPSPDRILPECKHHGFEIGQCGGCPWMFVTYEAQLKFKQKLFEHRMVRLGIEVDEGVVKTVLGSPESLGYRNRVQFKTDGKKIGYVERGGKSIVDIEDCHVLNKKNRKTLGDLRKTLPRKDWVPSGKFLTSLVEFDDTMSAEDVLLNKKIKFRQGNSAQNFKMRDWINEKTKLFKDLPAHELFCGDGNFTEVLSKNNLGPIAAVEMSRDAIATLKQKNLNGVHAEALDIFKPSHWSSIKKIVRNPEVVLLDPPRDGFLDLPKYVRDFPTLKTVIYVSCNPETFLNDLKGLMAEGFKAIEIQPIDQFPHTPHLELCAIVRRV